MDDLRFTNILLSQIAINTCRNKRKGIMYHIINIVSFIILAVLLFGIFFGNKL